MVVVGGGGRFLVFVVGVVWVVKGWYLWVIVVVDVG